MLPWIGRLSELPSRAVKQGWVLANHVLATTASIIEPLATLSAGTATALMPDSVLYAINEGLVPRLLGRRVDLRYKDRVIQGTLRGLEVRRARARLAVRATLDDLSWNGLEVSHLRIHAEGVQVIPGVPARIWVERIELRGDLVVESVVSWLNGKGLDWELYAHDPAPRKADAGPDNFVAYHRQRRIRAVIDASVTDDTVHVQVVRGRWYGLRIPRTKLTSWAFPLTPIGNDVRILHARRSGETVHVVLDLPSVKGQIDLGQMRDAIIAGTRYVIS
ncbi:hypothetical protein [Smaragdicoccus niigatensis]|uniref:hypothetical protein n=1 Tax=Smaragdicoccus niigatensis TaxID=359359 RepID=UPI00037257B0|nr:hypothetical protein [Smaragdicoccus niigatensis]